MQSMNPAHRLIPHHFPSKLAVARHFGKTKQAIRLWLRDGIPTSNALEIERVTNGAITAREILEFAEKAKAERAAA